MPVSLCEWRVRIGTFVHWIRDYEIRERKERWLKERTRILKVLCERLKAKKSDSKQETEEDDENAAENRQEGSNPTKSRQCPHKTNIKSSGNFDIKDLLTSCDQCIHDLLTPSHCCSKDLITPADGCIKELMQTPDSSIKGLISPDHCSVKALFTSYECSIKDLIISDDCSVKDLIIPDDCSLKALITAEDCSVKDLIVPPDGSVKTFNTSDDFSVKDVITPNDCNVSIKDLISPDDCSIRSLLTPEGYSVKDLIAPHDCSVKDLITPDDCNFKDLITPQNCSVKNLITPQNFSVEDLITPQNCRVKDLITPQNFSVEGLNTSNDCSVKDPITTPDDCSFKDLIMPDDFSSQDLHTITPVGGKSSVTVEDISRPFCNDERLGKEKEHRISSSLCHVSSLKSKTAMIPEQPPISELLLLKSGDVELNPGPREGPAWNLDFEKELMSLVAEISPQYYAILCNSLGFGQAGSEAILTKNLLNVPKSLFEIICSWGVNQRYGTNHKKVLADKLKSVNLEALGTKLLVGGYATQENPFPATDEGQHLDQLTPEQVTRCGQEFKTFYRTWMCQIKTDPSDFEALREFETIYTNLVLLRNEMGTRKKKTSLEYDDLLTTKINDESPKRLMVQGEGGSGKTTFCSKIAWDWSTGHKAYEQFDWVIVIKMREIQGGQSVGDIAKTYLSDSNMVKPGQINDYILSQPSKVFLIFDGLDEYGGNILEDESDFGKIIRSEKYKECTILVTSRPWKAHKIKSHQDLCKIYMFIGLEGFSPQNVSYYITKYFFDDELAGTELIQFIEDNEVVKMKMAPFPLFVAMLCILWQESTNERREIICKLKTFSQLFHQMIAFLTDHFESKTNITDRPVIELEQVGTFLVQVGEIAFSGLLEKKLTFNENAFDSCKDAMEMCTKVGVLSREKTFVSRVERRGNRIQPVTFSVSFPHKLFQEYLAALYLASLYDSDNAEYMTSIDKILRDSVYEFEYLIYFTSSQGKRVGLDMIDRLITIGCEDDFLVDVALEANNTDTRKVVGERVFAEGKSLELYGGMSAHTLSGYLFIMQRHAMETLILSCRSWGPTVSRDLAEVLSSSSSLTTLKILKTTLHDDFYRFLLEHVSKSKREAFINSLQELHIDHVFINALQRFDISVEKLFPRLEELHLNALQPVSPGIIKRLTHSKLSVFKTGPPDFEYYEELAEDEGEPVPLIGEPISLGQIFSSSFPHLTDLTFENVVIGNIRCEAILHSLRNHVHIKAIRVVDCFTDDKLDPLAREISTKKGIEITLEHDPEQKQIDLTKKSRDSGVLSPELMDALCHRTCVHELHVDDILDRTSSEELILDLNCREVDSKIHRINAERLKLQDNQSESFFLGRFISLLPCLTDLRIRSCLFHDEFYKEITERASSSKIHRINAERLKLQDNQSESCLLGRFISLLPCLTDLRIRSCLFHDEFYKEITERASFSKIKRINTERLQLQDSQSESCLLGRFISLLPYLTDLDISVCSFHDEFYKEIADRASFSKIQTMVMACSSLDSCVQVVETASRQLAKFLCSLPCLKDLTIKGYILHNDFFTELSFSPASSQIESIILLISGLRHVSRAASKQLAKFLCSLPRLKDLKVDGYRLHDDFFSELTSSPASSQNPCLGGMLEEWSARGRQQLQLFHTHELENRPLSTECVGSNLPYPLQSAQSSVTYQNDQQTDSQAESDQVTSAYQQQFESIEQEGFNLLHPRQPAQPSSQSSSHYPSNHQSRIQSESLRIRQVMLPTHSHEHESCETQIPDILQLRQPAQPSIEQQSIRRDISSVPQRVYPFVNPNQQQSRLSIEQQGPNILQLRQLAQHSTGQQNNHRRDIQSDLQQAIPSKQLPTAHSIGMNPMYEDDDDPDRPSTSRLSSECGRAGATLAYDERTPLRRKRIHSDTDSDDGYDDDDDDNVANNDNGTGATASAAAPAAAAADAVSIAKSQEHRPRKRLAKTDRNPSSP